MIKIFFFLTQAFNYFLSITSPYLWVAYREVATPRLRKEDLEYHKIGYMKFLHSSVITCRDDKKKIGDS